jgi:hypothetical protein
VTERDGQPDPVGDFQRWLMRSGARSLGRDLTGQIRRTLGSDRGQQSDVWDVATTRPHADDGEAPECAWCPVCRAARKMRQARQSGARAGSSGLGAQISGASDALASIVQEAYSAFEAAMKAPRPGPEDTTRAPDDRR